MDSLKIQVTLKQLNKDLKRVEYIDEIDSDRITKLFQEASMNLQSLLPPGKKCPECLGSGVISTKAY